MVTECDMKYDDLKTFHLLAFPKNKEIRSIRDITIEMIPLLERMVITGKQYIKNNFEINENEIETHFHYSPGVMLLHIHFEIVGGNKIRRPLREHSVHKVISNLLICPDYYKNIQIEILAKK